MDDWSGVIDNSALYTYYGRTGDLLKLEDMMESLQIYKEQGGKVCNHILIPIKV